MEKDEPKRFGDIAVDEGFATAEQVADALATQEAMVDMGVNKRIGEVLRYKGYMTRSQANQVLREQGPQGVPARIGGYEIVEKIGRGGMGNVYRALQISMNRTVALKLAATTQSTHIKRMTREARWIGRLSHPNIIQGFDVGEQDGHFYFAMEYVKGQTLHRLIAQEGALPERRAVSLAVQIAQAIGALWNEHIVHRDIKPGNIMVTPSGVAKLCDLGLAIDVRKGREKSLDEPGVAVGTPFYMAPEQVESKVAADVRSDLYSLGATLYRMVVGKTPFNGATRPIILSKQLLQPLPWPKRANPGLSHDICLLIAKLMAKDPNHRYQTVDQLVMDFEDFLAGRSPRIASASAPFWMPQARLIRDDRAHHNARLGQLRSFARLRKTCATAVAEGDRHSLGKLCSKLIEFAQPGQAQDYATVGLLLLTSGDLPEAHRALEQAAAEDPQFGPLVEVVPRKLCPEGMVYVPPRSAGVSPADGRQQDADAAASGSDEAAADGSLESVGPLYIGESPVTNRDYREFIMVTNYPVPSHWLETEWNKLLEDMPVTHVSWEDALAYAKWRGARLPTGAEWQLAAGGPEMTLYPWGDKFSTERCNCLDAGSKGPMPAGTHFGGRSFFGCYDMSGNVWEWTSDAAPDDPALNAVRGGSWQDSADRVTCDAHEARDPLEVYPDCGFRCAKDVVLPVN